MLQLKQMYCGDVYYPTTQKVYNDLFIYMNKFPNALKKFNPNDGFLMINITNGDVVTVNNGCTFCIPWNFFKDSFSLEKSEFVFPSPSIENRDVFCKFGSSQTQQVETDAIAMDRFFQVARDVKPRRKENAVLHLASEVGEIAECLEQPERGGNIVEESVDAILCALDIIYLELGVTHGNNEIVDVINKTIATKLQKWHDTKKK